MSARRHWWESLEEPNGAHVSDCGRYRSLLWRGWCDESDHVTLPMVFVMLNPSTADGREDDPTIRKCIGFARRHGATGIVVANLVSWRATDPRELYRAHERGEPVFRELDGKGMQIASWFGPAVFAWGSGFRPWMQPAQELAETFFHSALCLGRTKDGQPRHPLMLPYSTQLETWS